MSWSNLGRLVIRPSEPEVVSAGKSDCGEDDVSAGKFEAAADSVVFVAALVVGEPFVVSASVVPFDAADVESLEADDLPSVEESDSGGSFGFCAETCEIRR